MGPPRRGGGGHDLEGEANGENFEEIGRHGVFRTRGREQPNLERVEHLQQKTRLLTYSSDFYTLTLRPCLTTASSWPRGNNLERFMVFYLKANATARIWPGLSFMCHIRLTAVGRRRQETQNLIRVLHYWSTSTIKWHTLLGTYSWPL